MRMLQLTAALTLALAGGVGSARPIPTKTKAQGSLAERI